MTELELEDTKVLLIRTIWPNVMPPIFAYSMTLNELLTVLIEQYKDYKEDALKYKDLCE